MINLLTKLFPGLTKETMPFFMQGMGWALILLVVFFILIIILCLIFHKSDKVSGITLDTPHGSVFIAATAISDLIYSLDETFPDLEITHVKLIRKKEEITIRVKVFYAAGGQSMLALTEAFQNKALEMLKTSFGIDNISRIDLIVPKSKI
ncbi:MAG: hypothetical protein J5806_06875 [Lentisphaeria bacterium]|nr:hypothetical protein [Lentisphaeria bacterium]